MPAWTRLIGGWLLALILALALSWGAVSMVRGSVIESSGTVPRTVPSPNQTTAAPAAVSSTVPVAPGADTTLASLPESSSTTDGSAMTFETTTSSSPTTTRVTASTPSTSVVTSSTSTSTPSSSTSTTTTTIQQMMTTKTYQLTGGSVTISFAPGVVHFKAAVPQSGYSTDVQESGPERVRVEFERDEGHSKFRAEWVAGELVVTIDE